MFFLHCPLSAALYSVITMFLLLAAVRTCEYSDLLPFNFKEDSQEFRPIKIETQ